MSGLEFTNGDVKPDKHDENVAATRPTGRMPMLSLLAHDCRIGFQPVLSPHHSGRIRSSEARVSSTSTKNVFRNRL
jgi:hypothetical protein